MDHTSHLEIVKGSGQLFSGEISEQLRRRSASRYAAWISRFSWHTHTYTRARVPVSGSEAIKNKKAIRNRANQYT